jgi:rhodanese-related sulfurtransferase/polyisoprenoid-binding protein YceI
MKAPEVRAWLDEKRPFLLLDVLPGETHEQWHVPGSRHAAIYETSFLDQVERLRAPKDQAVVVYCSGPRSMASEEAVRRLQEAGYEDVRRFEGGRQEWSDAGYPVEGTQADQPWDGAAEPRPADGRYELDLERSLIHWTGRNAANSHYGTIRFAGGWVAVEEGELRGGEASADMRTIEVDDLEGETSQMLIRHLATGDFFQIDRYKTATFRLEEADAVPGAAPGQTNVSVRGTIELRGVTNPLNFPAVFARAGDDGVALQGTFQLDRTRFGSRYGSGRFFERLGQHLVNDQVTIQVRLVATR